MNLRSQRVNIRPDVVRWQLLEVAPLCVRYRVIMTTLEPSDYAATLEDLKRQVRDSRYTAQRRVNTELLRLYQSIGQTLLERTESEAWGSGVITQLANDLRVLVRSATCGCGLLGA